MSKRTIKYYAGRIKHLVVDCMILRGYRKPVPPELIIESTNCCSLQCSCCPNGAKGIKLRERGVMTEAVFDRILSHIDVPIRRCYLHMCGEPFLNPSLAVFVGKLVQRKITPVIYSNGYNIDEDLLREVLKFTGVQVAFSMDLLTPSHYEQLRVPARYEMAVEALERIDRVFESSGRYYMLNVIVDRETSGVVQQACECMYGRFKRLMGINLSSCWPWPGLPSTGDLAGHLSRRAYLCKQAKGALSVLWNGDVAFCALDYNGESIVGNLLEQRYSKVFNGRRARRWRRHLFVGATFPGHFCRRCLVPRYRGIEIKTFRNRYMKMPADERNKIFDRLQKYYDIDLPT